MKCEICLCSLTKVINCNLCSKPMCSSQCTLVHFSQYHSNQSDVNHNSSIMPFKLTKALSMQNQITKSPSLIIRGTYLQTIEYDEQFSIENFVRVYSKGNQVILGKGTFGEVYLLKHNLNGNFYAIKHMNKDRLMMILNSLDTIYTEIDIHSRLIHDNIIKILNVNETPQGFDLIMEYANGGSLFGLIKRNNGLNEKIAHKYFIQVTNAINFLHENNIIHRDLKPENILLDGNDHNKAKLCDFGWSIELSCRNRSTYCGTMEYMAPEIVNKANYDKAIDAWSLGVLLYELIHGYSPFRAIYNCNDSNEVVANIKSKHFKFAKPISQECKSMINALLDDDPSKRLKCSEIFTHPFALKYPISNEAKLTERSDSNNAFPRSNTSNMPSVPAKKINRQKSISMCKKEWINEQLNSSSIGNGNNVDNYDSNASSEITKVKAMIKKQRSIQLTNAKERISQINIEKKDTMNCFEDILEYSNNKKKSIQLTHSAITANTNISNNNNKRTTVESLLPELFDYSSSSTTSSIKQSNKIIKVFGMKTKIGREEDTKKQEQLVDINKVEGPVEKRVTEVEVEAEETNNTSIITENFLEKIAQPSLNMTKRGLAEAIKLINKAKHQETGFPDNILNQLYAE